MSNTEWPLDRRLYELLAMARSLLDESTHNREAARNARNSLQAAVHASRRQRGGDTPEPRSPDQPAA